MNNEFWLPVLTDGLFAAIAAIGFAVISNPPKRAISVVALLGAFGHACRFYLLHYTPLNLTISSLFAAFGIGMLSMLAARLVRCPAEVFSFPALLPMIPGMYAYKTVLALIRFMKSDDVSQSQQLIVEIFITKNKPKNRLGKYHKHRNKYPKIFIRINYNRQQSRERFL